MRGAVIQSGLSGAYRTCTAAAGVACRKVSPRRAPYTSVSASQTHTGSDVARRNEKRAAYPTTHADCEQHHRQLVKEDTLLRLLADNQQSNSCSDHNGGTELACMESEASLCQTLLITDQNWRMLPLSKWEATLSAQDCTVRSSTQVLG